MKQIILSLMLAGFAAAAQAGDSKTCSFECCSQTKASDQTKATCCDSAKRASKDSTPKHQALLSPKAVSLASK